MISARVKKSGQSEGQKPETPVAGAQLEKSRLTWTDVSSSVKRHSPLAVRHAVLGSLEVPLISGHGLLRHVVRNGSLAFAGTAELIVMPELAVGVYGHVVWFLVTQRPGYRMTSWPSTSVAEPENTAV